MTVDDLTRLSLETFLDQTAERSPTPGGGGVTGAVGALGCALARMVAGYSVNKKTDPAVAEQVTTAADRLRRADELLRALITQDAVVYDAMTAAGKAARADASRRAAYQEAVLAALAVPMEMAALGAQSLATMDEFKSLANQFLLSDLGIAAVLADATTRAARYTVHINAGELDDGALRAKVLDDVDTMVAHGERHRASVEAFVRERLEVA